MNVNNPWEIILLPGKDVNARLVDHSHKHDFFWAKDQNGDYLFVFEFPPAIIPLESKLPDLKGINIAYYDRVGSENTCRLVLALNEKNNWEMFFFLCNDLLEATRSISDSFSAVSVLLQRLQKWQEFLKQSPSKYLGEERIKGLLGELHFLDKFLINKFGAAGAIHFWQGPEGFPQDFNINNCAIEIKSQSGTSSPWVKISSEEQLCTQLPEMYLFVATLGYSTDGNNESINLPKLVNKLREKLVSEDSEIVRRFNDLLLMSGYIDSDYYLDFSYVIATEKMYKIEDGFPRLCTNELPDGIKRVSYNVDLHECEPFSGKPDWIEEI